MPDGLCSRVIIFKSIFQPNTIKLADGSEAHIKSVSSVTRRQRLVDRGKSGPDHVIDLTRDCVAERGLIDSQHVMRDAEIEKQPI